MPKQPKRVRAHLEKATASAISAVEAYNRPGRGFRTRTYVVLMTIAWTALFHAIAFKRGVKPWYTRTQGGRRTRYVKLDGDPKHWELKECVEFYYGPANPPERENLKFLIRLRNKIEHREHPELDAALYGECQSSLMNFEDVLAKEFGRESGLSDSLALALQFSALRPAEQERAIKALQSSALRDIMDFIQEFRSGLPLEIVDSSKFCLRLFLIPKLTNHKGSADLAVEFVPFDSTKPTEMAELAKVTALIREKRVPVASVGLLRVGQVLARLAPLVPHRINEHTHVRAWKYYGVRPEGGAAQPGKCKPEFCVYDELMQGYGYTEAWVSFLARKLADPVEFERVTGKPPRPAESEPRV